jgi:Ca2+-binding EF-hand superfamily protein
MKLTTEKYKFAIEDGLLRSFGNKETINVELLRVFLISKFDLSEIEVHKLLSYLTNNNRAINMNESLKININLGSFILLIKRCQKSVQENMNRNNNIGNSSKGFNPITSSFDEHKSEHLSTSNWVFKIANYVKKTNIDFSKELSVYDYTGSGYITFEDLQAILTKLNIGLTNGELNSLLNYFDSQGNERISIREFTRNFV